MDGPTRFTGIAPGTSASIPVDITLSGTYRDGSYVTFDAGFSSGSYGGVGDYLSANYWYAGNGATSNPSDPVSSTTFNLADACSAACGSASSGSWSATGPTQFSGAVLVYGDNPIMTVTMGISGAGYFDLGHTASLDMTLPPGVSFTSSSGVFLTAEPAPPADPPAGNGVTTIINSLLLDD